MKDTLACFISHIQDYPKFYAAKSHEALIISGQSQIWILTEELTPNFKTVITN